MRICGILSPPVIIIRYCPPVQILIADCAFPHSTAGLVPAAGESRLLKATHVSV
jgi:hypothetical protein